MVKWKKIVINDIILIVTEPKELDSAEKSSLSNYQRFMENSYYYYGNKVRTMTEYRLAPLVGILSSSISTNRDSKTMFLLKYIQLICETLDLNLAWFVNTDKNSVISLFTDGAKFTEEEEFKNILESELLIKN